MNLVDFALLGPSLYLLSLLAWATCKNTSGALSNLLAAPATHHRALPIGRGADGELGESRASTPHPTMPFFTV